MMGIPASASASARAAKEKLQQPFAPFPNRGPRKIESPLIRGASTAGPHMGKSAAIRFALGLRAPARCHFTSLCPIEL